MRYVVDASVVACWFFVEEHTQAAESLLTGAAALLAPDLAPFEVAGLLATRVARGELDESSADLILTELRQLPIDWTPVLDLAPSALSLAQRSDLALTDACYLALALQAACTLVTADPVLFERLHAGPFAAHAVWVGSLA